MKADEIILALRSESQALARSARRGLSVAVPGCPGWNMADLVRHVATGNRYAEDVVRRRIVDPAGYRPPVDPRLAFYPDPAVPANVHDDGLVDWFEAGAESLACALDEIDPATAVFNHWKRDDHVGEARFHHVSRAGETALHRWDAEQVYDTPSPIDSDLAAAFLDQILCEWLPCAAVEGRQAQGDWAGQSFHFQRTDGDGEWLVILSSPGRVETRHEPGSAGVTAWGSASDLFLLAMNKLSPKAAVLDIAGDTALFERWAADIRYGRPSGT